MQCVDPSAITPDGLMAYANGDADAPVTAHIENCTSCRDEAARYASFDRRLRRALFRFDCPSVHELGELALDLLPPDVARETRVHAATCPYCADELQTLRDSLADDPMVAMAPRPGLLARVAARLVPPPTPRLALAAVRGSSPDGSVSYEDGTLSLSLTVEAPTPGSAGGTILGMIFDASGGEVPEGTPIRVMRDSLVVAEASLDELGNVVVAGLEPGTYSIEVELVDRIVVVPEIDIPSGGA